MACPFRKLYPTILIGYLPFKRRSNRVGIHSDRVVICPITLNALPIWSYQHARSIAFTVCIFAIEFCIGPIAFGPTQNALSRCEAVLAWSGPCHGFIRLGFGIPNLTWLVCRRNPTRWRGYVRLSYGSKRNKYDRSSCDNARAVHRSSFLMRIICANSRGFSILVTQQRRHAREHSRHDG